jgi:hypothetical protein
LLLKSVNKITSLKHLSPFQAWNESQVFYFQNLSQALAEYHTCITFAACVKQINTDNQIQQILNKFVILFTLNILNNDIGTIRHNNYLKSETVDHIKEIILSLVSELSEYFIPILDIIAPPDHIIGAPMGQKITETTNIYNNFAEKLTDNFKKK